MQASTGSKIQKSSKCQVSISKTMKSGFVIPIRSGKVIKPLNLFLNNIITYFVPKSPELLPYFFSYGFLMISYDFPMITTIDRCWGELYINEGNRRGKSERLQQSVPNNHRHWYRPSLENVECGMYIFARHDVNFNKNHRKIIGNYGSNYGHLGVKYGENVFK